MGHFTDTVIHCYQAARELIHHLAEGSTRRKPSGRHALPLMNIHDLSTTVLQGKAGIGDLVEVAGWLSPYTYWYLPDAYLPYRLESIYLGAEGRQAMKVAPAPALVPAARIPFQADGKQLCFLYLSDKRCLDLELSQPADLRIREPQYQMSVADDQPWLFNLDTGTANFSSNPLAWEYQFGDAALAASIQRNPAATGVILTDPRRVRDFVAVPDRCKMVPIWLPKDQPTQGLVKLTGRLRELDTEVLRTLSRLGAPLSDQLYSLFYHMGAPAFCVDVQDVGSIETRGIASPRGAVIAEFFFEDTDKRAIVPFDDEAVTEWFLLCVKDFVVPFEGGHIFPDRWMGKIYGFDGPVYFYKAGYLELAISPDGVYTLQTRTGFGALDAVLMNHWASFFVGFTRRVRERFKERFSRRVVHRTTFLTEPTWQVTFGTLLEGNAFDDLRAFQTVIADIRREVQHARHVPVPLQVEDVEQFAVARQVPRPSITAAVEDIVRNLNERDDLEPLLRTLLGDPTETPHGSTEIADILTSQVRIAGTPRLAAFVNKGKATPKVTAKEVGHQVYRLRHLPGLGLLVLVAVGDIHDDIKRDLTTVASDIGCDYLIVDRVDVARLYVASGRICLEHGSVAQNGRCPMCKTGP